jgi:hypothetical protein
MGPDSTPEVIQCQRNFYYITFYAIKFFALTTEAGLKYSLTRIAVT